MNTYLYTWNPKRWAWVDKADAVYRVCNGDQYDMYWSCGNTKSIQIGDVFFLMRLGEDPKGIIGCGYISSTPYQLPHWDKEKADKGKTTLKTEILFKALSDKPIISLEELQLRYPAYRWAPQAGGLKVPDPIASEIFREIQHSSSVGFAAQSADEVRLYSEGKPRVVTSTTYDRSTAARQACIEHFGYNCAVCGFNFKSAYGDLGEAYIEVHHLHPIADSDGELLINPKKDLRPVCANCHRMLHRRKPPFSIDELIVKAGMRPLASLQIT